MIKLQRPFRLHKGRQIISMMEDPDKFEKLDQAGKLSRPALTVLGWGTLSDGGPSAKVLNYVILPYVSLSECRRLLAPYSPVYSGMMCAGDTKKGKIDACHGDSGGPLVYKKSVGKSDSQTFYLLILLFSEIQDQQNILLPLGYGQ